MDKVKKVAVIGSGVMGRGIAAQIANAKIEVVLLDIASDHVDGPNFLVQQAKSSLLTERPAPLSHPTLLKYITIGNLRDDLALLRDCDLVIEVIVEKLAIKQQLYQKILPYLKPTAFLASNTSTLPLKGLTAELPAEIASRMFITHFFNPPRYLELLELVLPTNVEPPSNLIDFLQNDLGKKVIFCRDTPGFIANRVGCMLLELAVRQAIQANLDPALIDGVLNRYFGFPKTGIFGLYDLIGHDVMALITQSLQTALPESDLYNQLPSEPILEYMRQKNLLGRKTKAGFYKLITTEAGKQTLIFDFKSKDYVSAPKLELPSDMAAVFTHSAYGAYFTKLFTDFLTYIDSISSEIASNKLDIDLAMQLGYNLRYGPFELATILKSHLPDLEIDIATIARNQTGSQNLDIMVPKGQLVKQTASSTLLLEDNVYIFTITTKANCLTIGVFNDLLAAVELAEQSAIPLIISQGNSANFSSGADLSWLYKMIINQQNTEITNFIELGQRAMLRLKYSQVPIIACAHGQALGGGCEILLHAHYVIAHQNLVAGLVETSVGLLPGWGGVTQLILKSGGDKVKILKYLEQIITAYKATSHIYFAEDFAVDIIPNMNKFTILSQAKAFAACAPAQKLSSKQQVQLTSLKLADTLDSSTYSAHQKYLLDSFQKLIDRQILDEQELLRFEKEHFAAACMNGAVNYLQKFAKK